MFKDSEIESHIFELNLFKYVFNKVLLYRQMQLHEINYKVSMNV